ncbi:MAG: hypothetical protein DHS20C17_32000 [Cyclobacteriaceae bacterium]|nr:MAG: hypothetical protein DHS20C17_32000 [Cyclobacteriaceae bacterium]
MGISTKTAEKIRTFIGSNICELSPEEKKNLGIRFGLKIIRPIPGMLIDSNLSEGFIVTKIDREYVESIEQMVQLLNKEQGVLIEGIYPDGTHDHYFSKGFQV